MDDLPVLESVEGQDGLGSGSVGEVCDRMRYTDFVVLKQDSMGFRTHGTNAGKGHDVALGHDHTPDVGVKLAVVVNHVVKGVFISGLEGEFVLFEDAHGPNRTN